VYDWGSKSVTLHICVKYATIMQAALNVKFVGLKNVNNTSENYC
jgi:hypothetical protein